MDLRQLEYFAAAARAGNVTRAAQEIYVTQSALSQGIRRLEAELGVALLRRTSRGVELTDAGAELLPRAERILADAAAARDAARRHAGAHEGVARVAAAPGDAPWLPTALAAFHAAHPAIRLGLRLVSPREAIALVSGAGADLAVVALPGHDPASPAGTSARRLREEPLEILCAPGDRLDGRDDVDLAELANHPLLLPEPSSALRATITRACEAAGFGPVPLLEAGDPAAVRTLAHAGVGVALVPASWLDETAHPTPGRARLRQTADGSQPTHTVSLLEPAAGASPAARRLADFLVRDA